MIKVIIHGRFHYEAECERCFCEFEYDKQDIGEYIENGEQVFKIRCPECGKSLNVKNEKEDKNES